MGTCISSEERAEKSNSYRIDRSIEKESKKLKGEYKILLLGSGESGKSTIFKQMKIIFQNGFTEEERIHWRLIVHRNIIQSIQSIVNALIQFNYQLQDEKTLYEIQRINEKGSEFYLMDSAPYFFENIKRIGNANYIPDNQDILRARSKTTGIVETRFTIEKTSFHMFDVGGQRSERKKWIHCFESVKSIIFCVSLSEYDQVLLEESRQNRMLESLVLFESVINSRWFSRTTIILFLNKIDLFQQKIKKVPMEQFFPDYGGGSDANKAAKYIMWRFNQTNRAKLNIYPHLTLAIDTIKTRLVFDVIISTIIQNSLIDSGIL
ncbi:G protein complex alpha subunit GpaB [Pilobolus umbonatus]|nr:G protein complex alpha subunit GpaB [Pilobolus umbonatus]